MGRGCGGALPLCDRGLLRRKTIKYGVPGILVVFPELPVSPELVSPELAVIPVPYAFSAWHQACSALA